MDPDWIRLRFGVADFPARTYLVRQMSSRSTWAVSVLLRVAQDRPEARNVANSMDEEIDRSEGHASSYI